MTGTRQHAYPALDGMRGVAAIAVLFHHFPPFGELGPFRNGLLAVDVFFAMSGFVIAAAYDDRLAGGLGAPAFMLARFIRLWPVLALGVAAGLVQALVAPVAGKDLPLDVGGRIVCAGFGLVIMPCPLLPPEMFPTDPPEWSLFYELLANLFFALAFAPLLRTGRMIALIGAAGAVLALGIVHFHGASFGGGPHGAPFELGRVGFSFFLGVLMHRTRPLWAPRLPRLSAWVVYALLLALLAAPTPRALDTPIHLAAVLLVSPLLIAFGVVAQPKGRLKAAGALLGALSYPLYALHMPILFLGRNLIAGWRDAAPLLDVLLVAVVVALAIALPSVYERAARRGLSAVLNRRPKERPV